jgi:probable phosphoglycerate mutase
VVAGAPAAGAPLGGAVLILVRHGRTRVNARGLLQGRLDAPLDEVGLEQAARLAEVLGPVDAVVTSPLRRARETAAALSPVAHVDGRWAELDYGELDGRPLSEVPSELWNAWRADLRFRPPGGETLAELADRVIAALAELAQEASSRDVVVVSHVSPIKAAAAWALGVDQGVVWRMHLLPASITRIGFGPQGPVLRSFNETLGRDAAAP